jgi:hypothetical protein
LGLQIKHPGASDPVPFNIRVNGGRMNIPYRFGNPLPPGEYRVAVFGGDLKKKYTNVFRLVSPSNGIRNLK